MNNHLYTYINRDGLFYLAIVRITKQNSGIGIRKRKPVPWNGSTKKTYRWPESTLACSLGDNFKPLVCLLVLNGRSARRKDEVNDHPLLRLKRKDAIFIFILCIV